MKTKGPPSQFKKSPFVARVSYEEAAGNRRNQTITAIWSLDSFLKMLTSQLKAGPWQVGHWFPLIAVKGTLHCLGMARRKYHKYQIFSLASSNFRLILAIDSRVKLI